MVERRNDTPHPSLPEAASKEKARGCMTTSSGCWRKVPAEQRQKWEWRTLRKCRAETMRKTFSGVHLREQLAVAEQ